jgi:hypothetical protein
MTSTVASLVAGTGLGLAGAAGFRLAVGAGVPGVTGASRRAGPAPVAGQG